MYRRLTLISIVFACVLAVSGAAFTPYTNAQSGGAVGFKVLPNPEHLSPLQWYQKYIPKENQGQPRELTIDGYEAVEDGRSVYVNAANYIAGPPEQLYTNIYVFSFDGNDPDGFTKEIYDRISENLKFSIIPGFFDTPGQGVCSISLNRCSSNFDCDYVNGETCSNPQVLSGDMLRRDVKRASDLVTFNDKLRVFSKAFGNLPQLLAGTFISGISYSTWPSWRQTLSSELGGQLPTDPINKFLCPPGTDPVTCWDAVQRVFVCPLDGYAYGYQYTPAVVNGGNEFAVFGANYENVDVKRIWGNSVASIAGCSLDVAAINANDTDADGIPNVLDNCNANINPNQQDSDADGVGDQCDVCPFDQYNDADCTPSNFTCDAPLDDASVWQIYDQPCLDESTTPFTYVHAGGTHRTVPALGSQGFEFELYQCDWGSGYRIQNNQPLVGDFDVSMQIEDLQFNDFVGPLPARYTAAAILNMSGVDTNGKLQSGAVHIIKSTVDNSLGINLSHIFDVNCWLDPTRAGCGGSGPSDRDLFARNYAIYNYIFTPGDTLRVNRTGNVITYIFERANAGNVIFTYPPLGSGLPPAYTTPATVTLGSGHGGEIIGITPTPKYGTYTRIQFIWNAICQNAPPTYPCRVGGPGTPIASGSGDGICADIDNCPAIGNVDQADSDGDGIGDACETTCGDGFTDVNIGEECDPLDPSVQPPLCSTSRPNTYGPVTCYPASAGPGRACTWNYSQCSVGTCGNGFVEPNEECEPGDFEITSCAAANGYSGLRRRECNDLTQTGACTWGPYNADPLNPTITCAPNGSCGDGIVQSPPEQCDLGAANGPNSTCDAFCRIQVCPTCGTTCGNGLPDIGEECGEGGLPVGTVPPDAQLTTCASINQPGGATPLTCIMRANNYPLDLCLWDDSPCAPVVCGDGNIQSPETCEPANGPTDCATLMQPQGTSTPVTCHPTLCQWQTGSCVFRPNECGNGVTETIRGEQCDDTNTVSNDECDSSCHIEWCGDGILQDQVRPRDQFGNYLSGGNLLEQCDPNMPTPNWNPATDVCNNLCQIRPIGGTSTGGGGGGCSIIPMSPDIPDDNWKNGMLFATLLLLAPMIVWSTRQRMRITRK